MSKPTDQPRIVIVCGPTGIGKTTAAIRLARCFGGQIVGADSMQIYRQMDIGTAKPTAAEQAAVTHHMIDVVDPDQPFDAACYANMAASCIRRLTCDAILPVVAGGTGFYIKALLYGLFEAGRPDPRIRRELERRAAAEGPERLHAELQQRDPASAERIHPHDRFRIVRALETLESTGRPLSALQNSHGFGNPQFAAFKIGLEMERETLYTRIDRRVEAMIEEGLQEEVESLLARGYPPDLKPMQAIGYRHMLDFLNGRTPWETTIALMKRDTRRYAKRQFTWFRADPAIVWTAPEAVEDLVPNIERFLQTGNAPDPHRPADTPP